jgi:hypothetical protein
MYAKKERKGDELTTPQLALGFISIWCFLLDRQQVAMFPYFLGCKPRSLILAYLG